MTGILLLKANNAVLAFLAEALESIEIRNRVETNVHEFEDCQYYLFRTKAQPGCLSLSFKHAQPLTENAVLSLAEVYQGIATISDQPEPEFHITLLVKNYSSICAENNRIHQDSFCASLLLNRCCHRFPFKRSVNRNNSRGRKACRLWPAFGCTFLALSCGVACIQRHSKLRLYG